MSEAVPPPVVQEVVQAAIVVGAAPTVESVVEGVDGVLREEAVVDRFAIPG